MFSGGFVEVLAAEQTPDSSDWFQGTADAVRQAARHFARLRRRVLPDPRRRSPLPDGLLRADRRAHREPRRHHDRRAAGRPIATRPRWASSASTTLGQIVGFEEKPTRRAARRDEAAARRTARRRRPDAGQAVRRVDGHLRLLARGAARHPRSGPASTSARRSSRRALGTLSVHAYLYRGYWADVGTIGAFYDANIQLTRRDAPFNFFHPRWPIYTHPRFLPATRALRLPHRRVDRRRRLLPRQPATSRDSVVGIRTHVEPGRDDYPLGAARRRLLSGRGCRAATRSASASAATSCSTA